MSDLGLQLGLEGVDLSKVDYTEVDLFEVGTSGAGDPIGGFDFADEIGDLVETDAGLETAIFLSLFCDRRADDADILPDGEDDRRGYWADEFSPVAGDRFGSRLWLIGRAKQVQTTLDRANAYAREALQWLVEDRVAAAVDVAVSYPSRGVMLIEPTITRPDGSRVAYQFDYNWAAQEARRG